MLFRSHGDFMYSRNELKSETIDGKKYITFRPNTITYAVPEGTTLSRQILSSRMGIVFHTTYHGSTMSNLQTHFDVDIGGVVPEVYQALRFVTQGLRSHEAGPPVLDDGAVEGRLAQFVF